jgi:PIN domain nuclease of toxin-antitoxin system
MRLLLDTHIWVWSVMEPHRLGKRMAGAIENPESELWLSPISIWEVIILTQKKRLAFENINQWIVKALRTLPLNEAPINNEVAREMGRLQLPHRDPADQFLVATAKVFDLTLATADELLLKAKDISVMPNR